MPSFSLQTMDLYDNYLGGDVDEGSFIILRGITFLNNTEWIPNEIGITTDQNKMCIPISSISNEGYFLQQMLVTTAVSLLVNVLLKPLGVPTYASHLVAGFITGASVLGKIKNYDNIMYPISSSIQLEMFSAFAMLFQLFLVGVQVNPAFIVKARKPALVIGIMVVAVPLVLGTTFGFAISKILTLSSDEKKSALGIALVQSINSYPVIVFYMYELNIVSLEFSHLAYSSSMISGLLCTFITGPTIFFFTNWASFDGLTSILAHIVLVLFILYVLRPYIEWSCREVPEGQTVKEMYMIPVYVGALGTAIICMAGKVHWMFGPFLYGMFIPSESPIGTTLVRRFELFNTWLMMPMFFFTHGLMINLQSSLTKKFVAMQLVVLATYIGKFLGAAFPALYFKMSLKEAILLGLTVNVQGFLEVTSYRILRMTRVIDNDSFEIMSSSMIFMTLILTPLLKYLYNRLLDLDVNQKGPQIIQSSTEFRLLACVYNQENVPSIIHLLKAFNPTKDYPLNVNLIHFVKRVGNAAPLIINHNVQTQQSSAAAGSQRIINVFKKYEISNSQSVSVHPYTVVSHYGSFSNDACKLAERQRNSLIVLPFHKELTTGAANTELRTVNCEVLDKATCSVGIVLDRGITGGTKYVLEELTSHRVVVFFFGGPDDREALTFATRMLTHPTMKLTVTRFFADYPDPPYSVKTDMAIDEEMIRNFRQTYADNNRVKLVEKKVKDGLGVVKKFEALGDKCELIMFGRSHDQNSPVITGLTGWDECSELGVIGDVFTSSDYGGKATIFIVQQQKNAARYASSFVEDDEVIMPSNEEELPFRGKDTISSC